MYYALKSALLLTLLYGGFSALLSRETFHRFNRVVLLAIVGLSLLLPTVHLTLSPIAGVGTLAESSIGEISLEEAMDYSATPSELPLARPIAEVGTPACGLDSPSGLASSLSIADLLHYLYIIGVAIALLRIFWRGTVLVRSLQGGMRLRDEFGNTVIVKGGEFAPFSFMHWIVISVSDYEQHRRYILTHEQAHARLGHSWDVLLIEAVQVVQWFNPFAWLLGRELKAIHEYEADEAVIQKGIDAKQYQQLLVIKAVGNRLQPFANTLNRGSLKQRINMMYQTKSSRWRMLRAAFAIPVAALALVAFATPETTEDNPPQTVIAADGNKADDGVVLVEYKTHDKWGKGYRDYYRVHLPQGVWVVSNGASHIEEQFFTYAFDNTQNGKVNNKAVMMLNGVPFDQNSLPKLKSSDLTKIEIKLGERATVDVSMPNKIQKVYGKQTTVNLITTPVTIPADVEGNVPRVQTLLLPGKGELYIKNGKAEPGDWMHCSITDWEKTSYGYSVRNEFERSKTKPGFKCWIYASTETHQKDIDRAEALMRELGIKNYEVVRGLPKKHYTDNELRQWARAQKAKGTAYSRLFDAMAPNHMDCADVHRQWHIVKAVYGKK